MAIDEREKKMSDGRHWPVGIIMATILIVIACAATIYLALLQPVQEDGDMMQSYHDFDSSANGIIVANVVFNKKYTLRYIGEGVSEEGSTIAYKLVDNKGKAVNNAKFEVILSRPVIQEDQVVLGKPRVDNGVYSFDNIKVPLKGRWNILARVSIGEDFRHMNLKSNTMDKGVYEYGLDKPMRNAGANN